MNYINHLKLLETEMKSRGFSRRIIHSYIFHVVQFLNEEGINPPQEKIKNYFINFSEREDPQTVNLRISALKFFYRYVNGRELYINYMKRPLDSLPITSPHTTKNRT